MSLITSEMTPADIAAVTNNSRSNCNDGWGGGWSSWIILFLIFGMFGFGGFGGFGGGWGGNNAGKVWNVMDELMSTLQAVNPKLYDGVLKKIYDL